MCGGSVEGNFELAGILDDGTALVPSDDDCFVFHSQRGDEISSLSFDNGLKNEALSQMKDERKFINYVPRWLTW